MVAVGQSVYATPYTITTLAGMPGVHGTNDGTGSTARFGTGGGGLGGVGPTGVAVDSIGNVYVADTGNDSIRKVTPTGMVTTIAGQVGISGTNDGMGSVALFNHPWSVALDKSGNVYVGDTGNNTIRELTPVGTNWMVTTLAGLAGVSGTNDGTNGGAQFFGPFGLAVDVATNLYVADTDNYTLREVMPVGTNWVVTTLAGLARTQGTNDGTNSNARFNIPIGVAVATNGNLYVADAGNNMIREVTSVGTNWVVTTLAGGSFGTNDGQGGDAQFNEPWGVAVELMTLFSWRTVSTLRSGN